MKPEFFTDETLGECSPKARLTFIATWVFADDAGNLERSAKQLKAQAFPYDEGDAIDVEACLCELIENGLLLEYEVAGKKYLHIKGFGRHQKIDNPSKPRHPHHPFSESAPRDLIEHAAAPRAGDEGKGDEGKGSRKPLFDATTVELPEWLPREAWARYVAHRKAKRAKLTEHACELNLRDLAKLREAGNEPVAVLEQSIANGWTGVFELKRGNRTVPPARRTEPSQQDYRKGVNADGKF